MEHIPLNKLLLGAQNVRTHVEDATDVEDLAASIKAHGLINPLVVVKNGKRNEVVAGGRRLRALEALAQAGELPNAFAYEVPVKVIDKTEAEEVSLVENFIRKGMRPYEIYRGFKMVQQAHPDITEAEIAKRFGMTEARAKRILRLGNLHPEVFELYATGRINDEQAQAFAATADHALQEKALDAFNRASNHWDKQPSRIKEWLGLGDYAAKRNLAKVGHDAYLAAGGTLEKDLFSEDVRIADPELLARLVAEKEAAERNAFMSRCSRPVTLLDERPKTRDGYVDWQAQVSTRYVWNNPEEEAEADALREQIDNWQGEEEDWAALEELELKLEALEARRSIALPEEGEIGMTWSNGETLFWLLTERLDEPEEDVPALPEKDSNAPSAKAMEELGRMRKARLAETVRGDGMAALLGSDLLVFTIARQCFGGKRLSGVQLIHSFRQPEWHDADWMQEPDIEAAWQLFITSGKIDAYATDMVAELTEPYVPRKPNFTDWYARKAQQVAWVSTPEFWDMFRKAQIFDMLNEVIPSFRTHYSNGKQAGVRMTAHQICSGTINRKHCALNNAELDAAFDWCPPWLTFKED